MVDIVDKRPPITLPLAEEVDTQVVETRKSTKLCKDSDGTVYVDGNQDELERQAIIYEELAAGQFPEGSMPKLFKPRLWRGCSIHD